MAGKEVSEDSFRDPVEGDNPNSAKIAKGKKEGHT